MRYLGLLIWVSLSGTVASGALPKANETLLTEETLKTKQTFHVNTKTVIVNGMACPFCIRSIEKKLKENSEVKDVKIDMDTKKVIITFHEGKSIKNSRIKKIIGSAGVAAVSITDGDGEVKLADKFDKEKTKPLQGLKIEK